MFHFTPKDTSEQKRILIQHYDKGIDTYMETLNAYNFLIKAGKHYKAAQVNDKMKLISAENKKLDELINAYGQLTL